MRFFLWDFPFCTWGANCDTGNINSDIWIDAFSRFCLNIVCRKSDIVAFPLLFFDLLPFAHKLPPRNSETWNDALLNRLSYLCLSENLRCGFFSLILACLLEPLRCLLEHRTHELGSSKCSDSDVASGAKVDPLPTYTRMVKYYFSFSRFGLSNQFSFSLNLTSSMIKSFSYIT